MTPTLPDHTAARGTPADEDRDDWRALLFAFAGRTPRRSFWLVGILGLSLLQLYLSMLLDIAGAPARVSDGLSSLAVLWPALAITAKRWHDRNRSAWWILINLVPVLGSVWTFVECGLLRGTAGVNRFGPPPAPGDWVTAPPAPTADAGTGQ